MKLTDAKYMTWGKTVIDSAGKEYKLVGDMDETTGDVEAVSLDLYRRWELLRTWLQNGVAERDGKVKEYKAEMKVMVATLKCENIVPTDKVKFITPHYDTLFEVANLGNVRFNGEVKRVIFLDGYHFIFEGGSGFHICQFAELAEEYGWKVEPVQ